MYNIKYKIYIIDITLIYIDITTNSLGKSIMCDRQRFIRTSLH